MNDTRKAVVGLIAANRDTLAANLPDFWRGQVEDMLAAGLPAADVVESMIAVAMVQGMKVGGATVMVNYLRSAADKFEYAAEHGVEHPAPEPNFH